MFRNIIFDLGNVFLFFDHGKFYRNFSSLENSFTADELWKVVTSKRIDYKLSLGEFTPQQAFQSIKNEFKVKTGFRKFCQLYGDIFTPNNRMIQFFERSLFRNDHKFFLLSNTDAIHFNYIKKNFPIIMKIKYRVLSFEIGMLKPDVEIYKYLLIKYRIDPKETIFIDDIHENIVVAETTGITGIQYTSHSSFKDKYLALQKSPHNSMRA